MLMHLLLTGILAFTALPNPGIAKSIDTGCGAGYFAFEDGSGLDIAPSDDGHFRWRKLDGTSGLLTSAGEGKWTSSLGWTGRTDGIVVDLSGCGRGEIVFADVVATRVPFEMYEVRFASGDAQLAGRLVLPKGREVVPVVVLVHGSEDTSALRFYSLQRMLPAQGVGVFVYDKRGTGASTGSFTHDIPQLASDAILALEKAKTLAGRRAGRVGFYGTSQGGWTAPLAASMGRADFVMVGYGLAVSPIDEDREALALDMSRHGFGAAETRQALAIGSAAQEIVRNGFLSGYDALRIIVARYKMKPWFRFVRGNLTGVVMKMPEADLRTVGPRVFAGLNPDYDPMPVLRKLDTPQLWILGGEDIDAPSAETFRRLMALRKAGHPISIAVYPLVEHGLYAFEQNGEERLSTRQPSSLQNLLVAFARGDQLEGKYDDATLIH